MKKNLLIMVALVAGVSVMTSCGGSSKQVVAQQYPQSGAYANPYAGIVKNPLFHKDTDDFWYAVGEASGGLNDDAGQIKLDALTNAQDIIRQKMSHSYQGLIENYGRTIGNSQGNDRQRKMERGGKQIIDAIVNNTDSEDEASRIDEKGKQTVYVVIKISKKQVAKEIKNFVSKDEDLRISYNKDKFFEHMDETFKQSKEE